ncbi:hypothetical protein ACJZ2D_012994 [Fusarium nematophilum]
MMSTFEGIVDSLWRGARHVAAILPAGTLLGAGVALRLPRHNQLDAVIILLLTVSGAISALAYRHAFQEARLGRIAGGVALGCIAPRLPCLNKALSPVDEFISCLRDYAIFMAVVIFVVAMIMPNTARRKQYSDGIAVENTNPLASYLKSQLDSSERVSSRTWDLSSCASTLSRLSDIGSLRFKHMSRSPSVHSGYSSSEESALTLSSGLKHDPALAMEVAPWATIVNRLIYGAGEDDEDDSVQSEPAFEQVLAQWPGKHPRTRPGIPSGYETVDLPPEIESSEMNLEYIPPGYTARSSHGE